MAISDELLVNDIKCERKENGKWKCDLFLESMFEPLHPKEVRQIRIKTPRGAIEKEPTESYKIKMDRKHEVVDDIDEVAIYNPWAVTLLPSSYVGDVEITPSKRRIMRCEVYRNNKFNRKKLYCSCEEAVHL